jgi:hypothetical protein
VCGQSYGQVVVVVAVVVLVAAAIKRKRAMRTKVDLCSDIALLGRRRSDAINPNIQMFVLGIAAPSAGDGGGGGGRCTRAGCGC